ncbi:MAG: NADH-quinone oxidoreductase subunit N [Deltaproteobacteria bacterium]|nr:NADH-quinone oxidoreductase subunit N [Deltaproteobacteria bacterium]
MTWTDLAPLGVELILLAGALSLLIVDLILPPGDKRILGIGTLGVFLAGLLATWTLPLDGLALGGAYEGDAMGVFLKRVFLLSGALAVLAVQGHGPKAWPRRQGEYHQLILYSVLGMSLLSGVRDLILLAVAFELMGVPLYALAAWQKRDAGAAEGALKLYLTGAVSSAATLYGFSVLYGLSGSTRIADVAAAVSAHPSPLLALGATVAVAGMGFKLGVVPFHMWVPDTYEGSPTPFIAFLSVGPKAAGAAALVQLLLPGHGALLGTVMELFLVLSAASLVLATLMALPQSNVKRLLAFSGIGHMGILLMAIATGTVDGLASLLFYLLGYLFTNAGAFVVVHAIREDGGDDSIDSFNGLVHRSWFLSGAMLLFLLSLAGVPFVVGFWAKLFVFMAAWQAGFEWLVILGALVSVLSLFYYLRVAKAMFMGTTERRDEVPMHWSVRLAVSICLIAITGMGLYPNPFVAVAEAAAKAFLG